MTDLEYNIIDELYFVTVYSEIKSNLALTDETLSACLRDLLQRGFVKSFYPDPDSEIEFQADHFNNNYPGYFFLASKAGLLAHNSR